jgi:poly-gamma-glutamate synthesis protein (capsule biosynthesis protein)
MLYEAERRDLTLMLTGDAMISQKVSSFREQPFEALVGHIRNADAAFTNLETAVRERHEGFPNMTTGTPMTTPPQLLEELKWMGFNLFSCANNHATDYGVAGLLAMLAHLERAQLSYAGIGRNLAEARAPCYLNTPAGRIALVAVTGYFRPWNRASKQGRDAAGRPGINPLSFKTIHRVDDAALAALERIADALGLSQALARRKDHFLSVQEIGSENGQLSFLGERFEAAADFGLLTRTEKADEEGNLAAIREARRQADWVILSLHYHGYGAAGTRTAQHDKDLTEPADFVCDFARRAIDAGADVVAGHGPHMTMGIEIYGGKPILYSLGNLMFQNDTVEVFPAEAYERFGLGGEATPADFLDIRTDHAKKGFPATMEYWEGIAATCVFEKGRLDRIQLLPLDLGFGRPRSQRGRPMLASAATAERILGRVRGLSEAYGTTVDLRDDTALITLTP